MRVRIETKDGHKIVNLNRRRGNKTMQGEN